ncbi:MAG: ThuA domain-containing protein, partial [Balneolales bacterium]
MSDFTSLARSLAGLLCIAILFMGCEPDKPKVLVFSKTAGFYHTSIPDGIAAVEKLGEENEFDVYATDDAEMFTEENLSNYAAVVFLSTTGDVLNAQQEADFERFIQAGGGFAGIHAAADTEYHWGWYGRLVGGYFSSHPGMNDPHPNVQEATLEVTGTDHPANEFLPRTWVRTDEWYSFRNMNEDVQVLLTLDEDSYQGGENMGYHPVSWYHEYDGGRAFYTGGGHTRESFSEESFLNHVLAGIRYAIGDQKLNYARTRTHRVPDENRFSKTSLV